MAPPNNSANIQPIDHISIDLLYPFDDKITYGARYGRDTTYLVDPYSYFLAKFISVIFNLKFLLIRMFYGFKSR